MLISHSVNAVCLRWFCLSSKATQIVNNSSINQIETTFASLSCRCSATLQASPGFPLSWSHYEFEVSIPAIHRVMNSEALKDCVLNCGYQRMWIVEQKFKGCDWKIGWFCGIFI